MVENLVDIVLSKLKEMVISENVIGKPIETSGAVVIPITKISLGFGAGGGGGTEDSKDKSSGKGSGTGGGIVIEPVAVITIQEGDVKIHPLKEKGMNLGAIIDMVPDIIKKFSKSKGSDKTKKKEK